MGNDDNYLPRILVIDDIYGWSGKKRKTFCINLNVRDITDDKINREENQEVKIENPLAEVVFFPGQKKQKGTIDQNDESNLEMSEINQKLLPGELNNEGWKDRSVEGKKLRNSKRRLKASIPHVQANSNNTHDIPDVAAFSTRPIHLKKPSGGPKGLIGPPCHGALAAGGIENDLEGTIEKIKSGWGSYPYWSMILLDLQFNTGECDEEGAPIPTQTDREKLFGINILERTWKDESLRDIPVIVLTQLRRNQIENKVREEFSKFDVVWEVVSKNELKKDKLIELLMDYALLSGTQVVRLLETMYKNNKSTETPLIIGHSLQLLKALRETRNVARNTELDIMLLGETGVGKELFAHLSHRCGKRNHKPFKAINCAAIPGDLFESELFGYMPGSFSGAGREGKPGLLETVKDGTFFLDEVGDLSLEHQAKLLRVIQNREFFRIGGMEPIPLKARLIYATNRDLQEEVKKNKFRRDLKFRIDFPPIVIPPLRGRGEEDIKLLAHHFIKVYQKKFNKEYLTISIHKNAEIKLFDHSWKGNVRELEYVIMKAVYRKSLGVISGTDIDLSDSSFPTLSFKQIFNATKNCDFEGVAYDDLANTLDDIQRFIIHLLNAAIKVYIKENRRGKFIIDEEEELSINLTRLMKQMLGIDQLDTTTAKRLFKSLCEILPEVVSQKHVEELSGKDRIFKNVLEKVSD